jgi:type VI secretion system protein ImpL
MPFRPDFLQCLAHANEITKAVFGSSPEPLVPFGVNVLPAGSNVSEITLVVDGKSIVYRNEPERWQPARWPGTGTATGGTIKVKGAGFTEQSPYDGEFGFFRLLAAGGVKPGGPNKPGVVVGTWALKRPGEPPVAIEFKPTKSSHPFPPNFFRRMRCPPVMLQGAP